MKIAKQLPILALLLTVFWGTTSGQATTLLSNMDNVTGGSFGGSPDSANQFATGSREINVTSIDLLWAVLGAYPLVNRVGFFTDNAGRPSTTLVGSFFTNPNPTSLGPMTYSGSVVLAANTTYWIVVVMSDRGASPSEASRVAYTTDYTYVKDPTTGGAAILPYSAYGDYVTGIWISETGGNLKFALNGIGTTKIGVYRGSTGTWYLDLNGNTSWDGPGRDAVNGWGGDASDIPVVGDWTGTGITKIGVYRVSTGTWYLDLNGNMGWDGPGVDAVIGWGGDASDIPVVGDWNGTGTTKIGVYRRATGTWYLDLNGNGAWDGCGTDRCIGWGGDPSDIPVIGVW